MKCTLAFRGRPIGFNSEPGKSRSGGKVKVFESVTLAIRYLARHVIECDTTAEGEWINGWSILEVEHVPATVTIGEEI